jgi:PAS domain S-box-containing protein
MNTVEKRDLQINQLNLVYISAHHDETLSQFFTHHFKAVECVPFPIENENLKKFYFNVACIDATQLLQNDNALIDELKTYNEHCIIAVVLKEEELPLLPNIVNQDIDGYLFLPFNIQKAQEVLTQLLNRYERNIQLIESSKNIHLLEQYQHIVDKSTIISKTDKYGIITYANENFCDVSGYSYNELIGQNHNIIRHPDNPPEVFEDMWKTIKYKKKEWTGIIKNQSKEQKPYYVQTHITPVLDHQDNIVEYVAIRDNISTLMSDKKQLMDKIESNKISFLILIQIEEFEMLDKFYNIAIVDRIEKMFGYELLSYLPQEYIFKHIYNIGEGRFALLTDFNIFSNTVQNLKSYLNTFVNNVKESTLLIDEIEYDLNIILSYSFGKHMLFEDAKYGLISAIKDKNYIHFANDASIIEYKDAKKNLEILKKVKTALDNYKIVSYFQPIINNQTQEIEKYESLVRLIDESGNVISPYFFLNTSKQGNYYSKIMHRVLENSFNMLNLVDMKISINLSSLDIEKKDTLNKIYELLEEHKECTSRIIFELLEDEDIQDFKVIKSFIQKVKAMGVQIAIDDFGAGYSNFERLLDFEPDILKIDGSLVKNIEHNQYSRNVVETIVAFAKKQNIHTIAEYVENENIFSILKEIGVDYSQGYYFGAPQSTILKV